MGRNLAARSARRMAGVVVLDAGVVIGYLNAKDSHHAWVLDLLQRHIDDQLVASALTHAEYLVVPTRDSRTGDALMKLLDFDLDVEQLDERAAVGLARVRVETQLRMPDAIVVHTALMRKASLATTDRVLADAARRLGIVVHTPANGE